MDVGASFNRALERFKSYALVLIVGFVAAVIALGLVVGIPTGIVAAVLGGSVLGGMLVSLVQAAITMAVFGPIMGGLYTMFGKVSVGATPEFEDLLVPYTSGRIKEYAIAGAVLQSPSLLGVIPFVGPLLAIPVSLAVTFLGLFAILMVAEGSDARTALLGSKDMVLANLVPVLILMAVMFALGLAGIIMCGIGLFATAPLALLVYCDTYLSLKQPAASQAPQGPEAPWNPPA